MNDVVLESVIEYSVMAHLPARVWTPPLIIISLVKPFPTYL